MAGKHEQSALMSPPTVSEMFTHILEASSINQREFLETIVH